MTAKIDALKRRLKEELLKSVSKDFISSPYDAIATVLWLLDDPQDYGIAIVPAGKLNRETIYLETKKRLHAYVDKYGIRSYSVSDALTDMFGIFEDLHVTVVDTRK